MSGRPLSSDISRSAAATKVEPVGWMWPPNCKSATASPVFGGAFNPASAVDVQTATIKSRLSPRICSGAGSYFNHGFVEVGR